MKKYVSFLLISLCISSNSMSDTGSLQFNGTVSTSCAFTNMSSGVLAVDPSQNMTMSTSAAGGSSGSIQLSYTGTPTLTVSEITSFDSMPSGFTPNLNFGNTVNSSTQGIIPFSGGIASGQYSSGNYDSITYSLSVSSNMPFATGNYSASSTVTCQ